MPCIKRAIGTKQKIGVEGHGRSLTSPCRGPQSFPYPQSNGGYRRTSTGTIAAPGRLDKALAEASGLSRERVKALLDEGRITLEGRAVRQASLKVAPGAMFAVRVPPPPRPRRWRRTFRYR
jgi:hypothetical protein